MNHRNIIIHLVAATMYVGGAIWAAVSFLLFLFKDYEFQWASVALFVVGWVIAIANVMNVFKKDKW